MKAIFASFVSLSLLGALSSCTQFTTPHPTAPPVGPVTQAGADQYGIPGSPATTYGAPYQPVDPINPPAAQAYPADPLASAEPVNPPIPTPSHGGQAYTVQKGDTLWGLSRRYGVSVDAIRQANSIEGDTIRYGTTIQIPGR